MENLGEKFESLRPLHFGKAAGNDTSRFFMPQKVARGSVKVAPLLPFLFKILRTGGPTLGTICDDGIHSVRLRLLLEEGFSEWPQ